MLDIGQRRENLLGSTATLMTTGSKIEGDAALEEGARRGGQFCSGIEKLACDLPSRERVAICNLGPFLWPLYLPGVEAAHIAKCPAARLPEAKVLAISRSPADLVERKEGTAPWGRSDREVSHAYSYMIAARGRRTIRRRMHPVKRWSECQQLWSRHFEGHRFDGSAPLYFPSRSAS